MARGGCFLLVPDTGTNKFRTGSNLSSVELICLNSGETKVDMKNGNYKTVVKWSWDNTKTDLENWYTWNRQWVTATWNLGQQVGLFCILTQNFSGEIIWIDRKYGRQMQWDLVGSKL